MKLRIMGVDVDVRLYPKSEMGDGKYSGRALLLQHKIKILDDMDVENQKLNLLHEILHFVDDKLLVGLDEKDVIRLSNFLLALMNDNPEVFKFTPKLEE